jgi:uncharacterized membrane protein
MAILLALVSALAYGVSDFVGGIVSRRASAWSVAVVGNGSATVCVALIALTVPGEPTGRDFAWGALAGVATGAGTGFLYRGCAAGRMGVVAPVSAVGAAVVPVLAGFVGGERFALPVWVGIAAALPGIWLVASVPEEHRTESRAGLAEGLVDGLFAGLGFGVLFAALGQIPDTAGLWPLTLSQAVSVPAVILLAVALRSTWVPRGKPVRWALLAGPLGAVATWSFLTSTQMGYLTISGVLTSLYPATTVLLAALVLHERVHRAQGVGLGLCAVAVALVAAG